MEKISKTMPKLSRVFLLLLLLNTLLFPSGNMLQKAIVKKDELRLLFSKNFNKKSVKHFTLSNPPREIYDFKDTRIAHNRVPLGLGPHVRLAQNKADTVRVVITGYGSSKPLAYQPFFSNKSYHISLPKNSSVLPAKRYHKPHGNTKKVTKKPTLIRSNKDKLIVIDAGHGGHDTGAIGGGKREKDLVLQISKRLERQLKKEGYSVHMTRRKDRFLKLPQRTKIADKKNAAIFISIHANSVPKRKRNKVHGVETFFLQKTRDAKSQRIAERENRAVLKGMNKLSRNVVIDSVLSGPKIVESNKLAIDVQRRIMTNLHTRYKGVKDGGVRHAPFWVLVGASRPSILVEVGYISHPKERKRLFTPRYQELIAKGIAEGVDIYLNNRKKEIDL
ncbi:MULTISPECIES: N-acetylmuramoyl-L-alanine amidase [Sulfurovum]|uniref:N-acetylmuramoyl-L-alanine amidase n=1 Tax=Sulfurovum xiamenensis TaxID=3019066 RepID=A0ABT7QNT6_9BACT|nr:MULTISPECIES: N-acetylmuramoyl-L-alanine amidase [Sulfurovum]EIF50810.1 N-acetylmuramoyl-L-alanine amidase [Sulfurovum sp. AR]MDM5262740.1 N-acetylmuramoyl-L-alanine amidase [Sulfurovum xiamenensis]